MKTKVLIFGGTTEGRRLSDVFHKHNYDTTLFVATDYGKSVVENISENLNVYSQRLDEGEMVKFLEANKFDHVIDATHPYASLVTANIKGACACSNTHYLRLTRASKAYDGVLEAATVDAAISILNTNKDKVLLTTGSKDLEAFTKVTDFANRLFLRIIPMADSLDTAINLGYKPSNIICMQGPFTEKMNLATFEMVKAKYVITKESGAAGGFEEKITAAKKLGITTIVISRPEAEGGYSFDEILNYFALPLKACDTEDNLQKKFPLFIDISSKKTVVIGGGNIAERRIKTLLDFGANITLISPTLTMSLKKLAQDKTITYLPKEYEKNDIIGAYMVISATDKREVNHTVGKDAKAMGILVSVGDCKEECSFWFPALAENGAYIAGVISKNGNHSGLKDMSQKIRSMFNNDEY